MTRADAGERSANGVAIRDRLDAVSVLLALVVAWIGTVVAFVALWSTRGTIWTAALGPDILPLVYSPFSVLAYYATVSVLVGATLAGAILVGRVLGDPLTIDPGPRHWGLIGLASALALGVGTLAGFEAIASPVARRVASDDGCAILRCGPLIVALSLACGLIAQCGVLGAIRGILSGPNDWRRDQ